MVNIQTVMMQGEHLALFERVGLRTDDMTTHDVLYRSRKPERVEAILPALKRAFERGREEHYFGWPHERPTKRRYPMFYIGEVGDDYGTPRVGVIERHPRLKMRDVTLYMTDMHLDAEYAMDALRRACSLGALSKDPTLN